MVQAASPAHCCNLGVPAMVLVFAIQVITSYWLRPPCSPKLARANGGMATKKPTDLERINGITHFEEQYTTPPWLAAAMSDKRTNKH